MAKVRVDNSLSSLCSVCQEFYRLHCRGGLAREQVVQDVSKAPITLIISLSLSSTIKHQRRCEFPMPTKKISIWNCEPYSSIVELQTLNESNNLKHIGNRTPEKFSPFLRPLTWLEGYTRYVALPLMLGTQTSEGDLKSFYERVVENTTVFLPSLFHNYPVFAFTISSSSTLFPLLLSCSLAQPLVEGP